MKIVHITNYLMPELGYQEYYLAKYQANFGHEVHVITSNKAYPKQSDYSVFKDVYPKRDLQVESFNYENFTVHRLKSICEFNIQLLLLGILDSIRSISPDVIYMHGFTRFETLHIAIWKRLSRKQFILIIDDHMQLSAYVDKGYRKLYYSIFKLLFVKFSLVDAIDQVVPISNETKQFLQSFFPIPENKISIINLGVDRYTYYQSINDGVALRDKLGIPRDAFLILYVGKIASPKKCDWVYEISREYLITNNKVFLLFVGSGIESEYANKIRESIRKDRLESKVFWCSHVHHDELYKYYSAADVAIWPFQETKAALEAASCSLPIILRNSTIAQEYTSNGNGFACSSLDEQKNAIGILIENLELKKEMGMKGEDLIRRKYDWEMVAKKFVILCEPNTPSMCSDG